MNDDLIGRQAAINVLRSCQTYLFDAKDPDKKIELESAIRAIDELPSVQPTTNCSEIPNGSDDTISRQGKWIYGEHDISMCDGYWCDKCGFFVPWDYQHKSIDFINDYHFCPSCGADMRGEQE